MTRNGNDPETRPEDVLIEALLQATRTTAQAVYVFDEYRLDIADGRLLRENVPVPLAPKEFRMLQLLVEHHRRLVTKQELLELVWGDKFVSDDTIAQRMSCLRKALGDSAASKYIETVPKRGYRFIGNVRIE
jgi:DNA-binding winged helix-turn-helix (wHTH) protein